MVFELRLPLVLYLNSVCLYGGWVGVVAILRLRIPVLLDGLL